jgi:hypothetical protein
LAVVSCRVLFIHFYDDQEVADVARFPCIQGTEEGNGKEMEEGLERNGTEEDLELNGWENRMNGVVFFSYSPSLLSSFLPSLFISFHPSFLPEL